jgi:release factor glutamine methyltransferase
LDQAAAGVIVNAQVRHFWSKWLWLKFKLFQQHRYNALVLERVCDVPLLVLPQVFNPKLMRGGELLAQTLQAHGAPAFVDVLDVGTGSGVGAIFAAAFAQRVVGTDINAEAVRCARINVLMNKLEHKVSIQQGDLFAPIANQQFDLVLFNPPFYEGEPRDALDQAWRGQGVAQRFAAGLRAHLKPGGIAWVLLSTKGDTPLFMRAFAQANLQVGVLAERELINERLTVYWVGV